MSAKKEVTADSKGTITSVDPLDTSEAKWVRLVKISYIDPLGVPRTWESSERLTRPANSLSDGVGIIAVLLPRASDADKRPKILLQKQYRPPIDKICIEVPAGLMDPNETAEVCALRELKEETGYTGTIASDQGAVSSLMFNDPGFCNTNLNFVHVSIDLNDERNVNPVQELEENEFIECFSVPLEDLWDEVRKLEKEGYGIDARVGTLAEGFRVAKLWGMYKS